MKSYKCVRCGSIFESNHKTAVCSNCHTAVCIVCGTTFELQWPYTQKTCSSKCRGQYRKESGIAKQVATKASTTLKRKYNVKDLAELQHSKLYHKVCKYCNQPFTTNNPRQQYCKQIHYGPCPGCGKPTEIRDFSIGPQACSMACRTLLIGHTCELKYGNKCVLASDYGQARAKQTNLNKLGVEHPAQTREYHIKCAKTRSSVVASDGVSLDSKYELYVYEFARAAKLDIHRQIPFEFIYDGNHILFVDFEIDNLLFECKGGHLIAGTYDNNCVPQHMKFNIYLQHDVILITDSIGIQHICQSDDSVLQSFTCIDITLFQQAAVADVESIWKRMKLALNNNIKIIDASVINNLLK